MKQYLTPEQTAKLIELGFEKPKGWYVEGVTNNIKLYVNIDENPMMFNYSIGELVSFLPTVIADNELHIEFSDNRWYVFYGWLIIYGDWNIKYECYDKELIDSLFSMCVKLKEAGVI